VTIIGDTRPEGAPKGVPPPLTPPLEHLAAYPRIGRAPKEGAAQPPPPFHSASSTVAISSPSCFNRLIYEKDNPCSIKGLLVLLVSQVQ
jgi:hypothetical protein